MNTPIHYGDCQERQKESKVPTELVSATDSVRHYFKFVCDNSILYEEKKKISITEPKGLDCLNLKQVYRRVNGARGIPVTALGSYQTGQRQQ